MGRALAILLIICGAVLGALSAANAPGTREKRGHSTFSRPVAGAPDGAVRSFADWWHRWPWRYGFLAGVALLGAGCTLNLLRRRMIAAQAGPSEMENASAPLTKGRLAGAADLAAPLRVAVDRTMALAAGISPPQPRSTAPPLQDIHPFESARHSVRERLDAILEDGCRPFAAAQHVLLARLGQLGYAVVMGAFAQGERRLHRAWSASVDGFEREAIAAIHDAIPHLKHALSELERRTANPTAPSEPLKSEPRP